MIKRRFYRLEHGERDSGSDSSSFSSDSEVETEDSAESEDDVAAEVSEDDSLLERNEEDEPSSVSSGSLNADSHCDNDNNDVGIDDDSDSDNDKYGEKMQKTELSSQRSHEASDTKFDTLDENELDQDIPDCMMRCKSVFKCKYCPNIICLNETTMRAHVASKKHARSEKVLKQGKFKATDSDGEVDNQEITKGIHAPDTTSVQEKKKKGSKRSRRQRKKSHIEEKELTTPGENVEVVQQHKKKRRQTKD